MASRKGIPQPASTVESQTKDRYLTNERTMSPRDFRDAVTKAKGSVRGVATEAAQWNRWTP